MEQARHPPDIPHGVISIRDGSGSTTRMIAGGSGKMSQDTEIIRQQRTDGSEGRVQHGKQRPNLLFFAFIHTEVQVEIKNSLPHQDIPTSQL